MATTEEIKKELAGQKYKYGWTTDIEAEQFPPGLNEDVVRGISAKKEEPEWLHRMAARSFQETG